MLESKLKEFERSLQKLKDCTYQEATQKREYERRVQSVQADLRGAHLREQVRLSLMLHHITLRNQQMLHYIMPWRCIISRLGNNKCRRT